MSKLVLAEKTSVAQSIAKVLGANKRCDGYLEGPCRSGGPASTADRSGAETGYIVSWCVGHLVELTAPEVYDEKYGKWRLEDLLILPDDWIYQVSSSTRKQYGILKDLTKRADEVLSDTSGWEIQGKGYLAIQKCDSGWDYTVCDLDFYEIDGGQIDNPELSMLAVRNEILTELQWDRRPMLHADCDSILDRIQEVQEKSVLAQLKSYKSEAEAAPEIPHPKKGQER